MTIETRSGKVVDSPYTNEEALSLLQEMVADGRIYGDFGKKLAGLESWSDEQLKWVHVLVVEAVARANEGTTEVKVAGSLAPVIDLLEGAGEHLEFPQIRLAVIPDIEGVPEYVDEEDVVIYFKLYRAGDRSKYCGQVQVKENDPAKVNYDGVPFSEENRWFGRIDLDGVFHPSRSLNPVELKAVVGMLKQFAADPATVAGKVGRWLGRCCFCHRGLSDERSTAVGYGPICASHYGLPWGVKDEEREMQEMEAEADRAQTEREERAKMEAREAMEREAEAAHLADGIGLDEIPF